MKIKVFFVQKPVRPQAMQFFLGDGSGGITEALSAEEASVIILDLDATSEDAALIAELNSLDLTDLFHRVHPDTPQILQALEALLGTRREIQAVAAVTDTRPGPNLTRFMLRFGADWTFCSRFSMPIGRVAERLEQLIQERACAQ